jgi:hypothetical protein
MQKITGYIYRRRSQRLADALKKWLDTADNLPLPENLAELNREITLDRFSGNIAPGESVDVFAITIEEKQCN